MLKSIKSESVGQFMLRASSPPQLNNWSVVVPNINDSEAITDFRDMFAIFSEYTVELVSAADGVQKLLEAVDSATSDYLLLHEFEGWHGSDWTDFDGFRKQLDRGKQGGALFLTKNSVVQMLHFAPNFTSWVGYKLYKVSLDSYLLTEDERQSKLVGLREWSGLSDDEIVQQAEHHQLPSDPVYAEWLILLDRGDLIER
jgi:hypothetical protein